jgi:hypothetical protein
MRVTAERVESASSEIRKMINPSPPNDRAVERLNNYESPT